MSSTAPSSPPSAVERRTPDTGHDLRYSGNTRPTAATCRSPATPAGSVAVSDVQPGSAHDLAAARATGFHGTPHAAAALLGLATLADKGYAGAGIGVCTPAEGGRLAPSTACRHQLLTRLRAEGERGIVLLKNRWTALHRIRLCPQRIGATAKVALVLTNAERPIRWRVGSWRGGVDRRWDATPR